MARPRRPDAGRRLPGARPRRGRSAVARLAGRPGRARPPRAPRRPGPGRPRLGAADQRRPGHPRARPTGGAAARGAAPASRRPCPARAPRPSTWPAGSPGCSGCWCRRSRRTALLRETLAPRLADTSGSTLGVPAALRPWLTERAGRMHQQLRRAGYAVAGGDLDGVLPAYPDDAVDHVADDRVLGLAIDLLLTGPAPRAGARRGGRMTKRVLLHVGTPKTGTSHLQDVLFRNQADARRARHLLPRRPVRRPLPGRARPDAAALGRPRDRGGGRLGPARRRGARLRGHRDRQPRDPRHRVPLAGRPGARLAGRRRPDGPRSTSCSPSGTWCGRSPPSGRRTSSTAAP